MSSSVPHPAASPAPRPPVVLDSEAEYDSDFSEISELSELSDLSELSELSKDLTPEELAEYSKKYAQEFAWNFGKEGEQDEEEEGYYSEAYEQMITHKWKDSMCC
jgi:hypothetical protein